MTALGTFPESTLAIRGSAPRHGLHKRLREPRSREIKTQESSLSTNRFRVEDNTEMKEKAIRTMDVGK
jgi:hypothetical protein